MNLRLVLHNYWDNIVAIHSNIIVEKQRPFRLVWIARTFLIQETQVARISLMFPIILDMARFDIQVSVGLKLVCFLNRAVTDSALRLRFYGFLCHFLF